MERYTKIRTVGEGAMGTAELVKRKSDGKELIVKIINVRGLAAHERADAMQEVMVHQELQHPNIASLDEAFLQDGNLYIVMEYANGGELAQLLRDMKGKGLPEDRAWDIFSQVWLAIHHVHSKGIIHRDIKPSNILLTMDGDVKLADFGIARVLTTEQELAETTVGTPYYMSPEICQGMQYNRKSDVWAMGCVLYEMVCGKRPFDGKSLPALVMKIVKGKFADIPKSYSPELRKAIQSMLQVDPDARPELKDLLAFQPLSKRVSWQLPALAEGRTPVVLRKPPPEALVSTRQGQEWMKDMQSLMKQEKAKMSKAPSLAATANPPTGPSSRALHVIAEQDQQIHSKTMPARPKKDDAKPDKNDKKKGAPAAAGKGQSIANMEKEVLGAVTLPPIKNAERVKETASKAPPPPPKGKDAKKGADPKNKTQPAPRKPQKLAALDSTF